MRKSLIVVAILAILMTSQSLAGGKLSKKEIRAVEPQTAIIYNHEADQSAKVLPAREVQIITKEKEPAPRVKACEGFATGLHYGYPVLAYKTGDYDFEIGYRNFKNDQMGLLRAGYTFWKLPEMWTYLKNGVSYFPGNEPAYGIFFEIENYITNCISVSGAIYPIRISTTGPSIVSDAAIGARAYF